MRDESRPHRTRGGEADQMRLPEFRESLSRLKDGGCNLLVTGTVGTDVTDAMSRRLLGASDHSRKRVIALIDRSIGDAEDLLPQGVSVGDPSVAIVDHSVTTRDGTTTQGTSTRIETDEPLWRGGRGGRTGTGEHASVDHLQRELCVAMADLEAESAGFEPAELRVAVVTLRTLLDHYDVEAVERLVRSVRAHVLGVSGMAHYHLPLPDSDELVQQISPLFDARIELRAENGHPPEQRWHLRDGGQSPWIQV